jgi:membrane protease YdiL (CAAX protease family)
MTFSTFAVVAVAGYLANARHGAGAEVNRLGLYASVVIAQLCLVRYITIGLRVPLREIIGGFRWFDVLIAAALFGAIRVTSSLMHRLIGIDDHTAFLTPRTMLEIGVSEEIVFRGYLQRRLPIGVVTLSFRA